MDRYTAALKLWKECRPPGSSDEQLQLFEQLSRRMQDVPAGADLINITDLAIQLKNSAPGLSMVTAFELVHTSLLMGRDPGSLEEAVKLVTSRKSGFARINLVDFIIRYSISEIKSAKRIWDGLPPHDQASVQVETLLSNGLQDCYEIIEMIIREMQTLQGHNLKVAMLLRDCVSPNVAFELFKSLRKAGPIHAPDIDLLGMIVATVGIVTFENHFSVDESSIMMS